MPTVRALVLVRDLGNIGAIEQVIPDIRGDEELPQGGGLLIRLSSSASASEITARISSFEGIRLEISGEAAHETPENTSVLKPSERVEGLMTLLNLSSPLDKEVVVEARIHLQALSLWASSEGHESERGLIQQGLQEMSALLQGESSQAESAWTSLKEMVSRLSERVQEEPRKAPTTACSRDRQSRGKDQRSSGNEPLTAPSGSTPLSAPKSTMSEYVTPEMFETFVSESMEHMDIAEIQLLAVETEPGNKEALNAVFRAFHTEKGSAGILGLAQIGSLAHQAENLLDRARDGSLILAGPVIDLVFDTVDALKKAVSDFRTGGPLGEEAASSESMASLIERIKGVDATPTSKASNASPSQSSDEPHKRLGEVLADAGLVTQSDVADALHKQSQSDTPARIGEVLVKEGKVEAREVVKALRAQGASAQGQSLQVRETVKVDADRLDQLLDTIGELVIAESMVCQSEELKRTASPGLLRHLGQLDKITRELQEMGTSLRMVPIRPTFQKMARLVRDLAHKSGKKVELFTTGEDTEIDKTLVDQIGDPLVHMIRNAVDHGIEIDPQERIKLGKPETGRVELRAYHKGGSIYIEVQDDGR
jgi:two-component system, chemotaxis family, sensor kinase CheA